MEVANVTELAIATVLERGVPNRECIAIKANEHTNVGRFGLMLGNYFSGNGSIPYFDNLFWFGDRLINPGDWLFVYTGGGRASQATDTTGTNQIYSMYWGKRTTLFAQSFVVPILFRVDAVNVLSPPSNQWQRGLLETG